MNSERRQTKTSTQKWLIGCGIGCGAIIVIVQSLAPFRSRLEAIYSELTNPLELALGQR